MLIVIDANELIALLIRGSKMSEAIFFSNNIEIIAPEFLLQRIWSINLYFSPNSLSEEFGQTVTRSTEFFIIEFANNKKEILEKTHRSKLEFEHLLSVLETRIKFIPKQEFAEFIPRAIELFPQHTKDAQYLALCLKFNCILWSEEKLLKKQSIIKVLNTKELHDLISNQD